MTIDEAILAAARRYNLDPNLLRAIAHQESRFNPRAVSRAGAQGLFQLMPGTAADLGVTDPFDPTQSAMGGAKYLGLQMRRFGGDLDRALAAYNAGPGNVRKYGGVPPFRETQDYVRKIKSRYGLLDADPVVYPTSGKASPAFIDDPVQEAIDAMPSVSPSKTTEADAALTADTVDKIVGPSWPGVPYARDNDPAADFNQMLANPITADSPGWTGSLTHPTDRSNNSTGAVAAENIPAWQSALGVLNPINLLQLPVRALRMVDYTLRTAAGSPTLTDQANSALDYVDSAYNRAELGENGSIQDALAADRTKTAGIRAQMGSLPERWVRALTEDPFEADRQALNAAKSLRARFAAIKDYANTNLAYTNDVTAQKRAPFLVDSARLDRDQAALNYKQDQAMGPHLQRKAIADADKAQYDAEYVPITRERDWAAKRSITENRNAVAQAQVRNLDARTAEVAPNAAANRALMGSRGEASDALTAQRMGEMPLRIEQYKQRLANMGEQGKLLTQRIELEAAEKAKTDAEIDLVKSRGMLTDAQAELVRRRGVYLEDQNARQWMQADQEEDRAAAELELLGTRNANAQAMNPLLVAQKRAQIERILEEKRSIKARLEMAQRGEPAELALTMARIRKLSESAAQTGSAIAAATGDPTSGLSYKEELLRLRVAAMRQQVEGTKPLTPSEERLQDDQMMDVLDRLRNKEINQETADMILRRRGLRTKYKDNYFYDEVGVEPLDYDAKIGAARTAARRILVERQGIANPSESQIQEKATELLHRINK